MKEQVRLFFALGPPDKDGYPPVAAESLWATPTGQPDEYILDNIPFFATHATSGDVVLAKRGDGGVLWFERMVRVSGESLLRIVFFQPEKIQDVRKSLEHLGCATEWDGPHRLVSVAVPADVSLDPVRAFLEEQAEAGCLDYEEAIIRQ